MIDTQELDGLDFIFGETVEAARQLVDDILMAELGTSAVVPSAEAEKRASAALLETGIVAAFDGDTVGDGSLNATGMTAIVREIAARAADIPLSFVLPTAVLPLARSGSHRQLLGRIGSGAVLAVGALREPGRTTASSARARAEFVAGGYVITGLKSLVPYGTDAGHILVPARTDNGTVGVFVVPTSASGVTVVPQGTGTYFPAASVRLEAVRVPVDAAVGAVDGSMARYLDLCAGAGEAAYAAGLIRGALRVTKEHVTTRQQFGRVLAQFQAVSLQVADAFIAETLASTLALASGYELSQGYLDEAAESLAAADLALVDHVVPAMLACMHVHGGLGLDASYAMYRYLSASSYLARSIGGREGALDRAADAAAALGAY